MPDATAPQTALITGAARRIGRAIALDLAAHGWRVGIHYRRSRAEAEALAEQIRSSGGTAAALSGDLAKAQDVASLIAAAPTRSGRRRASSTTRLSSFSTRSPR